MLGRSRAEDDLVAHQAQLPHGGTVWQYRLERAQWARLLRHQAEVYTGRLAAAATEGAANAAGIVALLEWLGKEFGPGTAWRAAAMLQDIAETGETWDETLTDVPTLNFTGDPPGWQSVADTHPPEQPWRPPC